MSLLDSESILSNPERDKEIIRTFLDDVYKFSNCTYKICLEGDDYVVNVVSDTHMKGLSAVICVDRCVEHLTNGMFRFGYVDCSFICGFCYRLVNLEGAPKEVNGNFSCRCCDTLVDLRGCPKKVQGEIYCVGCDNLESFYGVPENLMSKIICNKCPKIKNPL